MCPWWDAKGTIPTFDDAIARLAHLRACGPTPTAFTFHHRFPPDGDRNSQPGHECDACPAQLCFGVETLDAVTSFRLRVIFVR
jgi:hypothetical protein